MAERTCVGAEVGPRVSFTRAGGEGRAGGWTARRRAGAGGRERRDGNGTGTHLHRRVREGPRRRRSRRVKWGLARGNSHRNESSPTGGDGRRAVTDLATPMTGTSPRASRGNSSARHGVLDEGPPAHRDAAARRGVDARGTQVMRCVRPPARPDGAIDVEFFTRPTRVAAPMNDERVAAPPSRPHSRDLAAHLRPPPPSNPRPAGSTSRARRTPAGARPSTPRSARAPPSPSSPPRTRRYARSRRRS